MHRLLAISDDIFATVNRYRQAIIWIPWAFVLGAIQALASMTPVMLERGDPSSRDLHRVLYGLTLVYGGGWFIPALLISDFFLLQSDAVKLLRGQWCVGIGTGHAGHV